MLDAGYVIRLSKFIPPSADEQRKRLTKYGTLNYVGTLRPLASYLPLSYLDIRFWRTAPNCFYWGRDLFRAGGGGFRSRAEIGYANPAVCIPASRLGIKDLDLGFCARKAATEAVIFILFAVEKHVHIDISPQAQRTSVV
jgi:hypothetical protein